MNYMTQHLLEAIEINKTRKVLYSDLTNRKSEKLSNLLLIGERASLLSSYPLDQIAKYWRHKDVPVMTHEFISMDLIPEFSPQFESDNHLFNELPKVSTKKIQQDMQKFFKAKNYEDLSLYITKILAEFEEFPKHHCMVRHILESIRRSSNLLVKHVELAKEKKVRSPEAFCRYLLFTQIMITSPSTRYDVIAHPFQRDGIPILYQDVPYIPAFPDKY